MKCFVFLIFPGFSFCNLDLENNLTVSFSGLTDNQHLFPLNDDKTLGFLSIKKLRNEIFSQKYVCDII
jgi:hypothetical protein